MESLFSLENQIIVTIFLDNQKPFRHKGKFFVLCPHTCRRSYGLMAGKQDGIEGKKRNFRKSMETIEKGCDNHGLYNFKGRCGVLFYEQDRVSV